MALSAGDPMPPFSLPADGGGTLSSDDFAGKKLVVYFYPKDMTPGCTVEAEDFQGRLADFAAAHVAVIGVSKDSVARHDKFKAKHGLRFHLISDEAGDLCERFGVWVQKKLYGRQYMGIERATFLFDEKGIAREVWRTVKVKGHADAVLTAARSL